MSHHLLLILHLMSASVWVGGHLYLSLCVLPGVLKKKDTRRLLQFEKSYEFLGMSALLLLVITGIWMTLQFGIGLRELGSFSSPVERVVSTKLILLFATILVAGSAQLRVIPKLKRGQPLLPEMAMHIVAITLIGMAMLVLGSFVRYGGI